LISAESGLDQVEIRSSKAGMDLKESYDAVVKRIENMRNCAAERRSDAVGFDAETTSKKATEGENGDVDGRSPTSGGQLVSFSFKRRTGPVRLE
jgi:hypothetical protein